MIDTLRAIVICSLTYSCCAFSTPAQLYVLDAGLVDSTTDYTISRELEDLRLGATLGFNEAKKLHPKCEITLATYIQSENHESFQKRLSILRDSATGDMGIIGMTRSTDALTAAKIFAGSSVLGISAGAAANLKTVNSHFFSVASPLDWQWEKIKQIFKDSHCKQIFGYFSSLNGYSETFKNLFVKDQVGKVIDSVDDVGRASADSCIFFGSNFSESMDPFLRVVKEKQIKKVVGNGDWALAAIELERVISRLGSDLQVLAPSGWPQDGYRSLPKAARLLATSHLEESAITPILAYAYDAAVIAVSALCEKQTVETAIAQADVRKLSIRNYKEVTKYGNLSSNFFVHKFQGARP